MVKVSDLRYGPDQSPIMGKHGCRLLGAVRDASVAFAHARLFICSPHSREVVKTRFFTLFWSREPQKGCAGQPAGSCRHDGRAMQAHQDAGPEVEGSLWAKREGAGSGFGDCGARSGDVLVIGEKL